MPSEASTQTSNSSEDESTSSNIQIQLEARVITRLQHPAQNRPAKIQTENSLFCEIDRNK